uniref:C-type lectin domain-containing protein n=1 Tax=Acrobeloides nanus TaxID=290746 RepID=A0A914C0W4_9BILA
MKICQKNTEKLRKILSDNAQFFLIHVLLVLFFSFIFAIVIVLIITTHAEIGDCSLQGTNNFVLTNDNCGHGWYYNSITDKCYKVVNEKVNFKEHVIKCKSYGNTSWPVSIHSYEENQFILFLLSNAPEIHESIPKQIEKGKYLNVSTSDFGFYIGLTLHSERIFTFDGNMRPMGNFEDGTDFNYTLWAPGYPQSDLYNFVLTNDNCGHGWYYNSITDKCYKVVNEQVQSEEYLDKCKSYGSTSLPVSIHSYEENQFILFLLSNAPESHESIPRQIEEGKYLNLSTSDFGFYIGLWLDGIRISGRPMGVFIDGTDFNYTLWAPGYPQSELWKFNNILE